MMDLFDGLGDYTPPAWLSPVKLPPQAYSTAQAAPSSGGAISTAKGVIDLLTGAAKDVDQYLINRKTPQTPVIPQYYPQSRDNTLYYVIGGIAAAGLLYYVLKKRRK